MKRFFAMMLCGVMISSALPNYSSAAVTTTDVAVDPVIIKEEPSGTTTEPTTAALEKAILAVKEKITIPEAYSEFNYYFSDASYYSDAYWSFTWSNPSTYAYIQVNCDDENHITYFANYDYQNKTTGVAKYLKSELKPTADEFITKIAPATQGKLEYLSADYEGIYSGVYVFNYQRKENGVSFEDNTVTVGVNSTTGEVTYATINWLYGTKVPSSQATITKDQATAIIKKNVEMKLVYKSNYYRIYDTKGNQVTKAFLVYEPTLSYIAIDAKTGEVYLTKSEWVSVNDGGKGTAEETAATDSAADSSTRSLTDEEIAKVAELKNLISKQKAIETITGNPSLYLESTLKSYSASLTKTDDANGKSKYIWNVSLTDPREVDYSKSTDTYRAYAYATVDASTGKILSFYSSMKGYYDETTQSYKSVKVKYDKEKAREILEKFTKAQMSSRFENSVLSNEIDDYIAYYKGDVPVYGGYSYQYNRTNEKIEYPYNYIYGSVDGVTGKIYSFGSYWDETVVFESPKGAITADQAMDYYLGMDGYGLKYEINAINKYDADAEKLLNYYDYNAAYSVEYEIRLVYRPDVTPSYISPFTGKQLNYSGEEYTEEKPYTYKDIANTAENRNILLLADMGIGFEGENFLPTNAITVEELNSLLQNIGYSTEEVTTNKNLITREEAAQLFINRLGLEKMSKLGIYTTGYADAAEIDNDYIGAVALAKGLNIMTGNASNNFQAKNNITRFDAVNIIMNFIAAQQKGLY